MSTYIFILYYKYNNRNINVVLLNQLSKMKITHLDRRTDRHTARRWARKMLYFGFNEPGILPVLLVTFNRFFVFAKMKTFLLIWLMSNITAV